MDGIANFPVNRRGNFADRQLADAGDGKNNLATISAVFRPLTRTIPRRAGPGGEASATIVSSRSRGIAELYSGNVLVKSGNLVRRVSSLRPRQREFQNSGRLAR